MNFWSEIVGQQDAVAALDHAASPEGANDLAHAWLITGPPGSGRFNLALRFAAALVARDTSDAARAREYSAVAAGTHPDVLVVRTQTNQLGVEQIREAVTSAYYAPAVSPRRVIVIEDADRMNTAAANAALKALEEPPQTTVWILCTPAEADLLPTIRSRTRLVRLVTPDSEQVAQLLCERDGVEPSLASRAAQLAQGHIGMARRLAIDAEAMQRREKTVEIALGVRTLPEAMAAAVQLSEISLADAEALVARQLDAERRELMQQMGLQLGDPVPAEIRRDMKAIDDTEKGRLSRGKVDATDRVLLDLLALARDLLVLQLGAKQPLINSAYRDRIAEYAVQSHLKETLQLADTLEKARQRVVRNVRPELVLEAVFAAIVAYRYSNRK
ncbi:DNA polymerase III subunit delta' [Canibacter zhoujuaniae]|uniref:DNA polymerase III subunit delta' n=1 Tax=Canibacter zhoujuaniae TaxID=2708343 RepID=UPI00141EBAD2|nr:DNA polymerase III subunit delta' [Canibacter zhoujuaniae]